jgi:hypothetical protein
MVVEARLTPCVRHSILGGGSVCLSPLLAAAPVLGVQWWHIRAAAQPTRHVPQEVLFDRRLSQ